MSEEAGMTTALLASNDYEIVQIGSIKPHPKNPRKGDINAIRQSIREHGFHGAVVCQKSTRYILIGRHRWEALAMEGGTHIPVVWHACDDEEALRILLIDNRMSDLATYDAEKLQAIMKELGATQMTLDGTGWGWEDVDGIVSRLEAPIILDKPGPKAEYADDVADRQAKMTPDGVGSVAMKEVVVPMEIARHAQFLEQLKFVRKFFGMDGIVEPILRCVLYVAEAGGYVAPATPAAEPAAPPEGPSEVAGLFDAPPPGGDVFPAERNDSETSDGGTIPF